MITSWVAAVTSRTGAVLILLGTFAVSALVFLVSPAQPPVQATDGLPTGKQSTRVTELADRFPSGRLDTAVIVFERATGQLTPADQNLIASIRTSAARLAVDGQVAPAVRSKDDRAALVAVPLPADLGDEAQSAAVDTLRSTVAANVEKAAPGLTGQVTGGAAFSRDISAAFDGADVTLLISTASVVAVLLLLTYRSPVLWIVPLVVIGVGDQVVAKLLPWIAHLTGERTDEAVSGIVSVLVFGAGTDYALLLISRYREELRRTPDRRAAMAVALRGAGPAVAASAGTVVLALLTLLAATLTSNRTLGISAALGVAVALVFGLVVLPAAMVSLPRGLFWPLIPRVGSADPTDRGVWAKVAGLVGRRPVAVLGLAVLALGGLSAGLFGTHLGLSDTEQFRTQVESVTAQETLARHFPAGASQPVTVISSADTGDRVAATIGRTPGVAGVAEPETSDDGTLTQVAVSLTSGSGTAAADRTVDDLRSRLSGIPGALVGGAPAADLDQRDANIRDDRVIAPLVLGVVLLILVLLLRSLVAPVLLLLTVIASFAAALGAGRLVLRYLLDIPALDAGVPLLAFLFLVALGVDYNIFLITRAREETVRHRDTRAGILRALAVTGGVITSAGILLAAVFAVLGVLPVIVLTQLGVIVGIGVLLDTLLVRTLLVPSITLLLGERFWWPATPARAGASDVVVSDEIPAGRQ